MPYSRFFDEAISKLKGERRYRVFADIERDGASLAVAAALLASGRTDS